MRSDHLLRQGQHQAAVPRHATRDVMLVEEDLNLLEINDRLLGPEGRQFEVITDAGQLPGGRRRRPGARERCRKRRCEHIRRRTSTRRLAGERGSDGEKQIVRNHRRRTSSGENPAATICARHGEAGFICNGVTSCNNSHKG